MRDVSFSYGGTEGKEVLRHLNLTIPQGKFTALVGPSGGGKSTIARLTARFWDVTGGSITLGGQDIRKLPLKQLSQSISFVTQDNFLFDCSLKENIRLGKAGGFRTRRCSPPPGQPSVRNLFIVFQTDMRPGLGKMVLPYPAGNGSGCPLPGPF